MTAELTERNREIYKRFKKGQTLGTIAKEIGGISRQRVHQIIKKYKGAS